MASFRTLVVDDLREILPLFGIDAAAYRSHRPIAAGTINTNVAVELASGRRFLRVNEGKTPADVAYEAAIVRFVAAGGVPTPVPALAADGGAFVTWRGLLLSLFPWVEGRTLARAEMTPDLAQEVGAALARLHLVGLAFPDRRPGLYEPDEIERRLNRLEHVTDPAVVAAVATLAPALRHARQERRADVPLGLIHGDLFIDNVLFHDRGGLSALLDFEQASWGRLVYDVAVTSLAFAYGVDDFRLDVLAALLTGYESVRKPTFEERAAFGEELAFASCRFAVTRITDVYLKRGLGAPGGKRFERYLARLATVQRRMAQAPSSLIWT